MKDHIAVRSSVGNCKGVPTLFLNGAPFAAAAYMTYLEERNDYASFAAAGYRLFSFPVLFAGRWINSRADCKPFHGGIFDQKDAPDYSSLDKSVRMILAACPDAYIIPRLNLSMPLWWTEENPEELDGTGKRESLYSEKYRKTAADMLNAVLDYAGRADWASHIAGLQLAGGNTEEWFHFDLNAGVGPCAERAFNAYLEKQHPFRGFSGLPDLALLKGKEPFHQNEHLTTFLHFASEAVADDILFFAAAAKKATGGRLAVGTFYGYALEVASPLWGTHALNRILASPDIDFISSPNSYVGTRDPNADWTEMYPAASVRLHGKLCLQECDVRTHLTRTLPDSAPGYEKEDRYASPIWQPLPDKKQSVSMLRKTFSRQLIAGNGFWWFDMWGGWYHEEDLLSELRQMREIFSSSLNLNNRESAAEIAAFTDETAFARMTEHPLRELTYRQRTFLGFMGAPYDLYDIADFETVYEKYRAVLFLSPAATESLRRAVFLCEKKNVPFLSVEKEKSAFSAARLRAFCKKSGVHVYCETNDLIYVNRHFLAVHATEAGDKTIRLPEKRAYRELFTDAGLCGTADTLSVPMQKNETKLLALTLADSQTEESK